MLHVLTLNLLVIHWCSYAKLKLPSFDWLQNKSYV